MNESTTWMMLNKQNRIEFQHLLCILNVKKSTFGMKNYSFSKKKQFDLLPYIYVCFIDEKSKTF